MTSNFVINDTDEFKSSDFPLAVKELDEFKELVKPWRYVDNEVILVSYLKDHMIRCDLARTHPGVVKVLIAKNACRHLEHLFVLSKEHAQFRLSLENYVIDQVKRK